MKKARFLIFAAVFIVAISCISDRAFADSNQVVPNWVKNVVTWWSQGQVTDDEFLKGIKFLVENDIIKIDSTNPPNPTVTTDKQEYKVGEPVTISGTGFAKGDVVVTVGNIGYLQDISDQANAIDWSQTSLSEMSVLTQYQYSEDNVGTWEKISYPDGFAMSTKVHTDDSGNWSVVINNSDATDQTGSSTTASANTLPSDAYILKAAQKITDSDGTSGSGFRDLAIKTAYTNISVQ